MDYSSSGSATVDIIQLQAALGQYEDPEDNVLDNLLKAICTGYSPEQIINALVTGTLEQGGDIECLPADRINGKCFPENGELIPANHGANVWRDCNSPQLPPNIHGTWKAPGYWVRIARRDSYSYWYTGEGDGNFKHTGYITWYKRGEWYEGNLADVEGYCCGNVGYTWVKVFNEDEIGIKAYWTTPDGDLVKDNTDSWYKLLRHSHNPYN